MGRIAMLGAVLLAAGCAGAPRVVDLPTRSIFRGQELGGGWPVVVLGQPFAGVPPDALAAAVVENMPQGLGQNVRFEPAPPGVVPERRAVFAFGGTFAGGDGSGVCQSATGGGPQSGRIRVFAALCRGPSAASAVQGDIDGVTSPDDPGFRSLVRTVTQQLLSPAPGQTNSRRGPSF